MLEDILEIDIPNLSLIEVWQKQSSSACCSKVRWIELATRRSNQLCNGPLGVPQIGRGFSGDGRAYLLPAKTIQIHTIFQHQWLSHVISMLEVLDYSI